MVLSAWVSGKWFVCLVHAGGLSLVGSVLRWKVLSAWVPGKRFVCLVYDGRY